EDEAVILAQVEQSEYQRAGKKPGTESALLSCRGRGGKCWTGDTIRAKRYFPAWAVDEALGACAAKAEAGASGGRDRARRCARLAFCTNGSHFCGEAGIPTMRDGPSLESLAHVRDEYIEIAQLTKACRGFESILSELTKGRFMGEYTHQKRKDFGGHLKKIF
ncbi:MAG: hypothetical protein V8S92_05295, partial [Oscillospiraceae bacterium]